MHRCQGVLQRSWLVPRIPSLSLFLLFLLSLSAVSNPAHAGTAVNQLCGAAGYGAGCIGAFKAPKVPPPKAVGVPRGAVPKAGVPKAGVPSSGGGMFGGVMGSIVGNILMDAVMSGLEEGAAGAAQQAQQAASIEAARAESLRQAVEEQRRLQEARESQFLSTLLDRPASQLIGTAQDLTVLETARAEAGRPFDGNALTDPHGTWMAAHDVWFSPEAAGTATAGSQPAELGNWPLPKSSGGLRPVECLGRVCGFPRASTPAVTLRPIPRPSPGASPSTGVQAGSTQSVTSEWRESGDRILWAARQRFDEAAELARARETHAEILSYGWVRFAEGALPGMQREVAREGRGIYQRVVENLLTETMEVMSDAFAGRWQQALEKSDTIGERVKESLLSEYKMSRRILAGDARGAGEVAGEVYWDHAKDVARERVKDGLLDRLGGPEWVQEGARASADVTEHWLKTIFKGKQP